MSKWRVRRVPKPIASVSTIVIGAAMAIAAGLALPQAYAADRDCSLFQVRLATSEYPALEVHFCALVPSTGGAVAVRYDVSIHVSIMPAPPR